MVIRLLFLALVLLLPAKAISEGASSCAWPADCGGVGGGSTDLNVGSKTGTTFDVTSSTGTNATLPAATDTEAGLQTAAQKSKLDDIPVEFDAIIDISSRATMCQNWATAVESFMDGTYGAGNYEVAVVGTPSSSWRPQTHGYDDSGAWPYYSCFMLHPQDGVSADSPWPDSLGVTADVNLSRDLNAGVMTLHMLHGEIRVDQFNDGGLDKNACLFDFGNSYLAGHNAGSPWGLLGGRIRVKGYSRVVVGNASTAGYTGGGAVGDGLPEPDSSSRLNKWSTSTFSPFCFNGATYVDASEWRIDAQIDADDIGGQWIRSWGMKYPKVDFVKQGAGVGLQFFGEINGDIPIANIRQGDYGVVWGGGDLPSGADDDRVHYYSGCQATCTAVEKGVRGARLVGGTIEGHDNSLGVMVEDEKRNGSWNTHWECGAGCAKGGILYRPRLCDGTGTTPEAAGMPLASDAAEATACAASGGNANSPEEPEDHFTVFSLLGMPTPEGPADDVPNIWFGSTFTEQLTFVFPDGAELGTMTATSTGDDAYAPFKVSADVDCDGADSCGKILIGATNTTPQDHSAAPAGVPHVAYGGLIRSHPLSVYLGSAPLEVENELDLGTFETFGNPDTTPDISGGVLWVANATNNTITNFDGSPSDGTVIVVRDPDGGTVLDCTASNLECGTADITMAANSVARFVDTGTNWTLLSYAPQDDDLGTDGGSGTGAFSDAADPIVQNTTGKDVHIGDGVGTLVGKMEIGGDADQPQLIVEGHSTQTDSIVIIRNNAGTELVNIDADGNVKVQGLEDIDGPGTNFELDASGNLTVASVTVDPSATPGLNLKDSDATAGDVNARWEANCTDVGDGTEDCDTWLESQTAGTTTTRVFADADGPVHIEGGNAYIGPNATPSTPATATGEGDLFVEDALEVDGATDLDGSLDVAGATTLEDLLDLGTFGTFGNPDTTPDISGSVLWVANATNNTITNFDGSPGGGHIFVLRDTNGGTVLDCTSSNLECGTADITMAAGDTAIFLDTGPNWSLLSYVDQGDDLGSDATGSGSLGTNLSSTTDDILSDNGTLRLGGTGGTNNEDLDFDFETTANEVGVSSSTGATQINLGSLGMLTTGDIRGHVHLVTTTGTTDSPSADEMRGTFHVSNNASGTDYTLPTAVAGMSACFYDLNGGGVVTLDANTGDVIYLDGTALDAGDAIDSAGALGDFICLLAIDATNWLTLGRSGTWVDGGVD